MSGLGFRIASPTLHNEGNLNDLERVQTRFFQKQFASDGGCMFRAFNNAVGKPLIDKRLIRQVFPNEKDLYQNCPKSCPEPGKDPKLMSLATLERLIHRVGYSLKKVSAGRSPNDKLQWMLQQKTGRFLLVTTTDRTTHARDAHNLTARNYHHWIAVSADENLVIDSLARSVGPQGLSQATLKRSVRDGIWRIYKIQETRQSVCK